MAQAFGTGEVEGMESEKALRRWETPVSTERASLHDDQWEKGSHWMGLGQRLERWEVRLRGREGRVPWDVAEGPLPH